MTLPRIAPGIRGDCPPLHQGLGPWSQAVGTGDMARPHAVIHDDNHIHTTLTPNPQPLVAMPGAIP